MGLFGPARRPARHRDPQFDAPAIVAGTRDQGAAERLSPFAHALDTVAATGLGHRATGSRGTFPVVVDEQHDVSVRYVAGMQFDGYARPRRVLADVGQGLLDDAQNRLADQPGE